MRSGASRQQHQDQRGAEIPREEEDGAREGQQNPSPVVFCQSERVTRCWKVLCSFIEILARQRERERGKRRCKVCSTAGMRRQ